jgi:hypothetical protein
MNETGQIVAYYLVGSKSLKEIEDQLVAVSLIHVFVFYH